MGCAFVRMDSADPDVRPSLIIATSSVTAATAQLRATVASALHMLARTDMESASATATGTEADAWTSSDPKATMEPMAATHDATGATEAVPIDASSV
jgi:hypothetical protein